MSAITKKAALRMYDEQFKSLARYWAQQPNMTNEERCNGVLFSIMSIIDGCSILPALDLVLHPHPDDKEDATISGSEWFEPGMVINDEATLHDGGGV